MDGLQQTGSVPFDLSVLQSLFPDCKHITDKALRLEADGRIVRLNEYFLQLADMEEHRPDVVIHWHEYIIQSI